MNRMSEPHLQALFSYTAIMGIGTLLALVRHWYRPKSSAESVWKKYPTYLLLNITFLMAAWLPHSWHTLAFLLAIIGAGASWELCRALGLNKTEQMFLILSSMGLILAAEWLSLAILMKIWLAVILAFSTASALDAQRVTLGRRILSLAGCGIYLPICLASALWIWHAKNGAFYITFLYLVIATNESFGQFSGQLFGHHPLAPHISPAKTVEGALGGLFFAALLGAALSSTISWSIFHGAVIGLVIGLSGLIGDLTESSWKRALGLKDFSTLLGPQGGALDRFDGLIFAAPIFFLLLSL